MGEIPKDWCQSVIVSIYNKDDRSSYENQRNWFSKHRNQTYGY